MNKAEMNFIRIGLFFSCVLICGLNCDSESAKLNNDVEDEDLTSEQESYVKGNTIHFRFSFVLGYIRICQLNYLLNCRSNLEYEYLMSVFY